MPRIYVDFDDVICETARALADLLRRERGWAPDFEDIREFDLHVSFRLDRAAYDSFMALAHRDAELLALDEIPGACATLRAWLDDGLEPIVVTGRPPHAHAASRAWLDARGLSDLRLVFADKYNRFAGPAPEGVELLRLDGLRRLGFALAIDDAPPALDFVAQSGLCPAAVFDRPWNRAYGPTLPRVRSWAEADTLVRRFLRDGATVRPRPAAPPTTEETRTHCPSSPR